MRNRNVARKPKKARLTKREAILPAPTDIVNAHDLSMDVWIEKSKLYFTEMAQALTARLAYEMTPGNMFETHDAILAMADALGEFVKVAREKTVHILVNEGTQTSQAGSVAFRWEKGGRVWEKKAVVRMGVDPQKIEALLRAKGFQLEKGMDATIEYKPNQWKLQVLVAEGQVTQDELDACQKSRVYAASRSTELREGETTEVIHYKDKDKDNQEEQ